MHKNSIKESRVITIAYHNVYTKSIKLKLYEILDPIYVYVDNLKNESDKLKQYYIN